MKIFPRVFKSGQTHKIYFQTDKPLEGVSIKLQGMEYHTTPHTSAYRIDEEGRYPYLPMQKEGEGLYSVVYVFTKEQKYSVKIKAGEELIFSTYVYAVDEDLAALKPFKGDTHLHTNRSDGAYSPFETGCNYRGGGYDFIAVTDHHKLYPSKECKEAFAPLTDMFTVFIAEEVHNKDMGYIHIINFGGEISVNIPILNEPKKVEAQVQSILKTHDFTGAGDPYVCAYGMFVAEEIRKGGGLAIMAHPFWECYGEYHMQSADVRYQWKNGTFDALEVLAGCDCVDGNNLQVALWTELLAEGLNVPVVGASDCHDTKAEGTLFKRQYTLVFAKDSEDIKVAIKENRAVAVLKKEEDFFVFGRYRYVKYARFLMEEYMQQYEKLAKNHAEALFKAEGKQEKTPEIYEAEKQIEVYRQEFFAL